MDDGRDDKCNAQAGLRSASASASSTTSPQPYHSLTSNSQPTTVKSNSKSKSKSKSKSRLQVPPIAGADTLYIVLPCHIAIACYCAGPNDGGDDQHTIDIQTSYLWLKCRPMQLVSPRSSWNGVLGPHRSFGRCAFRDVGAIEPNLLPAHSTPPERL